VSEDKIARCPTIILSIDEMKPWEDNPRIDLQPGDPDYENIKKSLAEYDYLQPIVWNKKSGRIVGGHQRLKVLKELGYTHAEVRVVDYDEQKEMGANLMLNKAVGRWDDEKLPVVFQKLDAEHRKLSGFSDQEIKIHLQRLEHHEGKGKHYTGDTYTRADWGQFKIWHAVTGNLVYIAPNFRYLLSMAVCQGKPPENPKLPGCELFVDSGLLTGARKEGHTYYQRQGELIQFAKDCKADWCTMMDIPLEPGVLTPLRLSVNQGLEVHLKNAQDFHNENLGDIKKVMVVQGADHASYRYCAEQMQPYVDPQDVIAVGGMSKLAGGDPEYVSKAVAIAKQFYPGHEIHLFGITSPRSVVAGFRAGATSCDSAVGSLHMSFSSLAFPVQKGDGYTVGRQPLRDLAGFPLSVGGKIRPTLCALNMAMVEAAIYLEAGWKGEEATPEIEENEDERESGLIH
jgi:hypothetical protein